MLRVSSEPPEPCQEKLHWNFIHRALPGTTAGDQKGLWDCSLPAAPPTPALAPATGWAPEREGQALEAAGRK